MALLFWITYVYSKQYFSRAARNFFNTSCIIIKFISFLYQIPTEILFTYNTKRGLFFLHAASQIQNLYVKKSNSKICM